MQEMQRCCKALQLGLHSPSNATIFSRSYFLGLEPESGWAQIQHVWPWVNMGAAVLCSQRNFLPPICSLIFTSPFRTGLPWKHLSLGSFNSHILALASQSWARYSYYPNLTATYTTLGETSGQSIPDNQPFNWWLMKSISWCPLCSKDFCVLSWMSLSC